MNEFLKEERVLPKGILKNNCPYIDSVLLYEDHGGSRNKSKYKQHHEESSYDWEWWSSSTQWDESSSHEPRWDSSSQSGTWRDSQFYGQGKGGWRR